MRKWNQFINVIVGIVLVGMVFMACEDFEDETYEMTTIDAAAVYSISDTLVTALPMKSANILNANGEIGVILAGGGSTDTVIMSVDTSMLEYADIYTALADVAVSPMAINDTVYSVTIQADSLSFIPLEAATAGTFVMYFAHYAAPNIYTASGDMVTMASDDMSPELIAGLYTLPGPVPTIKGRYEYELDAGEYLFEIARLEATTASTFRVVFMREQ